MCVCVSSEGNPLVFLSIFAFFVFMHIYFFWLALLKLKIYIDVRQCLLYDSTGPHARLIGVEYMVSAKLFATLPPDEKKLWHSHVYEAKSGMLIMPKPASLATGGAVSLLPDALWEKAERAEMEQVVHFYGKMYVLFFSYFPFFFFFFLVFLLFRNGVFSFSLVFTVFFDWAPPPCL